MSEFRFSQRALKGAGRMSKFQFRVLQYLRDFKKMGDPYHMLPVHSRTIKSLLERDYIFESKGLDGVKYCITGRGLAALAMFEQPKYPHRVGDVCYRCRENAKKVGPSGRKYSYCHDCLRELHRTYYRAFRSSPRWRGRPVNPICPTCQEKPRHVFRSGRLASKCYECYLEYERDKRARYHARQIELAAAGHLPMCTECGTRPRHVTNTRVYWRCRECLTALNRRCQARRAFNTVGIFWHEKRSAGR